MALTVGELIQTLSAFDPEQEVVLAMQPSWPFEYTIGDVVDVEGTEDLEPKIYLVEGTQTQYLPGHASEAIGWS